MTIKKGLQLLALAAFLGLFGYLSFVLPGIVLRGEDFGDGIKNIFVALGLLLGIMWLLKERQPPTQAPENQDSDPSNPESPT